MNLESVVFLVLGIFVIQFGIWYVLWRRREARFHAYIGEVDKDWKVQVLIQLIEFYGVGELLDLIQQIARDGANENRDASTMAETAEVRLIQ